MFQKVQAKRLPRRQNTEWLLKLLLQQTGGKLALLFDNLESVQAMGQQPLQDDALAEWLAVAQQFTASGLKLILTSRWHLPDWSEANILSVDGIRYADYKALARTQQLTPSLLDDGKRLRHAHHVLGGNPRALGFFITTTQGMDLQQEIIFLETLAASKAGAQADMALSELVKQRSDDERLLLDRMLAYQVAIPLDGIKIIMQNATTATPTTALIKALWDRSLLEVSTPPQDNETEYLVAPLLRDWLLHHGSTIPDTPLLQKAASFMLWLLEERINTVWEYRIETHKALQDAAMQQQACRLVLKWVVEPLNRTGQYQTLLDQWLLPLAEVEDAKTRGEVLGEIGKQYHHIDDYDTALTFLKQPLQIQQEIGDKSSEGTTLNNISQIYSARGDYDTALTFLKQSLQISQEIGDKSGMCATLFNMGHIHAQNDETHDAIGLWLQVYGIAKSIHLAQALDALESLAGQLGQEGGLQFWEGLAQQANDNNHA